MTLYAPSLVLSSSSAGGSRHDPAAMGGPHDRLRGLGRQPLGDLDGRRADGARLARRLRLRLGRRSPSCRLRLRLRDALALAQAAGRLEIDGHVARPARPYTLWSGLIGGMFLAMAYFGCDQSQVQRYLSGRSLAREPHVAAVHALLKVPMQFLILLTGRARVRLLPLPRARRCSGTAPSSRALEAAGAAGRSRARRGPGSRRRTPSGREAALGLRRAPGARAGTSPRRARRRTSRRRRAWTRPRRRRGSSRSAAPAAGQRHQLHLPDATS